MFVKNHHSQELNDVIERPQEVFSVVVFCFLLCFVTFLIVLGVIIKSPDIVVAEARVSTAAPPVVLTSQIPGRLCFVKDSLPSYADSGECLAYIANAADFDDIQTMIDMIADMDPFSFSMETDDSFLSLGEISTWYYQYKCALQNYQLLARPDNELMSQLDIYRARVQHDRIDLVNCRLSYENSLSQLEIKRHQFQTDSILYLKNALLESEFQKARLDILNAERYLLSSKSDIDSRVRSLEENEYWVKEYERRYDAELRLQRIQVMTAYKELVSQIKGWEAKYVLKTASAGYVELANLISNGDYVAAGTPVFNMVFENSTYHAVAMLPPEGAGKVTVGEKVNIKLSSFPFAEYGTLSGFVQSISQNPIEKYYLVYISLPDGLASTTGAQLYFAETLYGQAEIVTRERRLISRIFSRIYEMSGNKAIRKSKTGEEDVESKIHF